MSNWQEEIIRLTAGLKPGEERIEKISTPLGERVKYGYLSPDGKPYTTNARTEDECRERRRQWEGARAAGF